MQLIRITNIFTCTCAYYPTRIPVSVLSFCTDCPPNYNLDQMINGPFAFPSFQPSIANDIQYL